MRRANTLRKTGSENLTLGDDLAHKITLRIQNPRATHQDVGKHTEDCNPKT
jgi:hypothetical protein